jgi:hypothetical protein
MSYIIYLTIATVAGGALLALVSDAFAYEMSRILEAALDSIEYRLARRAKRRGASRHREREAKVGFDVTSTARAGISL